MEELNQLLNYKDLKIFQDKKGFKFSLDSVLLASFSTITYRQKKIIDVGTGNAPIPLLLSKKTTAHITGIELQKESALLAQKSVEINHLDSQISIICEDVREWYKRVESDSFDLMTCNPPFFAVHNQSYMNESTKKKIARHELTLTIDDICKVARKILKNNGYLSIVHRPERLIEIIECMKKNNIEPKKIRFVYPYPNKSANILLLEGSKNGKPGLKVLDPLYVYNESGEYTKEVSSYFSEGGNNESKEL